MHNSFICRVTLLFGVLLFLQAPILTAQQDISVDWMTFEEAVKAAKDGERKIFIDMYTDWCGYCKKMDKVTFQNPEIARYLNKHFYPVKFDAESRRDISFKGTTYQFIDKGKRGYHELAAAFSQPLGRLSYPTLVFIDENLNMIQPIQGYQDPRSLEVIITYIAENHYKSTPWKKYHSEYVSENFNQQDR